MAQIPLKISNIQGNELELISRLKGINTPWKKTLLTSLSNGNWLAVYQDLLYRIEFWSENKVLSYTKQDLNTITKLVREVGLPVVAQECVKKYVTSPDQAPVPVVIEQPEISGDNGDVEESYPNTEQQKAFGKLHECNNKIYGILKLQFIQDIKSGELKGWKQLFVNNKYTGLTYFDSTNPTDTILEIVEKNYSEFSDFVFDDGEEFVEKVLELVKDRFIELSEKLAPND